MLRKKEMWFLIGQILYWGIIAGLLLVLNFLTNRELAFAVPQLITSILFPITGILTSYAIRAVFYRFDWIKMNWMFFPRVLLTIISGGIVMAFFTNIAFYFVGTKNDYNLVADSIVLAILIMIWMVIFFIIQFASKSKDQEIKNERLQSEMTEMELQILRSQLNPHFLFNSLNTVRALVDINPEQAKANVTHLANMLRKSLTSGKLRMVTLKDEIELVTEYLELEKVRFEDRISIRWELDRQLDDFHVPPFIIQTLVENAVKHGITKLISGGEIAIITEKRPGSVSLRIENDGKLGKGSDTGIGLENTARRLSIEYEGRAEFSLFEKENRVIAEIIINDKLA